MTIQDCPRGMACRVVRCKFAHPLGHAAAFAADVAALTAKPKPKNNYLLVIPFQTAEQAAGFINVLGQLPGDLHKVARLYKADAVILSGLGEYAGVDATRFACEPCRRGDCANCETIRPPAVEPDFNCRHVGCKRRA